MQVDNTNSEEKSNHDHNSRSRPLKVDFQLNTYSLIHSQAGFASFPLIAHFLLSFKEIARQTDFPKNPRLLFSAIVFLCHLQLRVFNNEKARRQIEANKVLSFAHYWKTFLAPI